jgi:biopolymer transport protein ExbB
LLVTGLTAAAFTAVSALAQGGGPAGATTSGGKSLLSLIWQGMEWPAYLILAGSLAVITLIAEHFITVRRATIAPSDQVKRARDLIEMRNFRDCLETMRSSSTFFAKVMTAALQHARHGFDAMYDAAQQKSHELSGRMFRKVEHMNIIGNLGPLMGLLGTVLGMIVAFAGMSGSGADAAQLSRGISLALVNTLLGLALAIVGLGFFGACRNRIDSLTVAATGEALDLLEYFRPAAGPGATGATRGAEPRRTAPAVTATETPRAPATASGGQA